MRSAQVANGALESKEVCLPISFPIEVGNAANSATTSARKVHLERLFEFMDGVSDRAAADGLTDRDIQDALRGE